MNRIVPCLLGLCLTVLCLSSNSFAAVTELNLKDFGAVGDGVTDDGPAFRAALDALAAAGGGTLFVPAGKYVIATPVVKDFGGLASSVTITGVESSTPVAPPNAGGQELSLPLNLPTEIYPRTGEAGVALAIMGVQNAVVKEIAFVGTPLARTDAVVTVFFRDIDKAQVKHCEFYGLSTLVDGGAIVGAIRSDLEITKSKFLGTIATSGGYLPVVQNLEWRGITVTDTIFLDYGQREFFGKTFLAAPISWVNIGNAAQPTNLSPRREVVLRNVFMDEGGYWGLSSMPLRYVPQTAPIDLVYVTNLEMNVSNFNQYGHHLTDLERVFIEKARYGWSQNAAAAINLMNVGSAILDKVTCEADADHIVADSNTRELSVINSTYAELLSSAPITNTISTTDENDPVQYVRRRFVSALGRDPDPAAHYYWSDLLLHCFQDSACSNTQKATLNDYLSKSPAAKFSLSGRVKDEQGSAMANVTVTLSGSQSVTTKTDLNGDYIFANLPTSGQYTVTPAKEFYVFDSPQETFVTPSGDRIANFTANLNTRIVKGTIKAGTTPLAGVTVTLSGSANGTAVTDNAGAYSFTLERGGNYTFTPAKAHYTFEPASRSVTDLRADTQLDFGGTVAKHSISGRVVSRMSQSIAGVVMTLSGSATGTAITAADGSYAFTDLDGGGNYTITGAKDGYGFAPPSMLFNDLGTDIVANFQAGRPPVLLTVPNSNRAVALELTRLVADPFPLTNTLLADGRNRTRIMLFATDLELLPGEGVEVLTAEAEDDSGVRYPLRVEFVGPLPELPNVMQLVVRLTGDLEGAGEVMVNITAHGRLSNQARILIGQ